MPKRIFAIIGGGFCGTLTAVHLLRHFAPADSRVVLIEREPRLVGRGVAYGTTDPHHLLNVPAGRMSALPNAPEDFTKWLAENNRSADPSGFPARRDYGAYLFRLLLESVTQGQQRGVDFRTLNAEAIAIDPTESGYVIRMADDSQQASDCILLAMGNFPPSNPRLVGNVPTEFYRSSRYVRSPWRGEWLNNIAPERPVMILGTGLTAVDAIISLSVRGHRGPIYALSRRGFFPHAHPSPLQAARAVELPVPLTLRMLWRELRSQIEQEEDLDTGWQRVIDGLRPHSAAVWQGLSAADQRRFLRHARAWWDVRRHRMAPEIATRLKQLQDKGQLEVLSGRLTRFDEKNVGVAVSFRDRLNQKIQTRLVDMVINCTGPEANPLALQDRLTASLIGRRQVAADELKLGLQTTADGQIVSPDGQTVPGLFAAGPLRKGQFWEITAVPELREQMSALAKSMSESTV